MDLSTLKVFYLYEFEKESYLPPVQAEIKEAVRKCAFHLKENCNSKVKKYIYDDDLSESAEMCIASLLRINLDGIPNLLEDPSNPKVRKC